MSVLFSTPLIFLDMGAEVMKGLDKACLHIGSKNGEWLLQLSVREVFDVIGYAPLTRREIGDILAQGAGVDRSCFPQIFGPLLMILVELRKSGWIARRDFPHGVVYTRNIDITRADHYPFSNDFIATVARRFSLFSSPWGPRCR